MEHFDIAITNGLLLDSDRLSFSNGFVFLKDGKVVSSPGPEEAWEADQIIDAQECYVLPGLIDEHAHFDYQGSNLGVSADILCPPSGVTTAVDAGSTGCDNFDLFYRANISRYVTQVLSYINVSSFGVHCSFHQEENLDPRDFDASGIEARFRAHPSTIRGMKIRLDQSTLGEKYSLASLEQCLRISEDLQKKESIALLSCMWPICLRLCLSILLRPCCAKETSLSMFFRTKVKQYLTRRGKSGSLW